MNVRHLNCATMCPIGGPLAGGTFDHPPRLICHVLLIETENAGLVLVDTGLGLANMRSPYANFGAGFVLPFRPVLDPAETAASRLRELGYDPRDVRHILLTHLDVDHAGGLSDFPDAEVHIYNDEYEAALTPRSIPERMRYVRRLWSHGPIWRRYARSGTDWFGFESVRDLRGLPPEILLVPLVGHTRGHCAIAVQTRSGWLLHAGDAYYHHDEMRPRRPCCPPALEFLQTFLEVNRETRTGNQRRLRELVRDRGDAVRVFCAHDPRELAQMRALAEARAVSA